MSENHDRKKSQIQTTGLYIVGIGASAGGLEAIEKFLRHTPADSGLAYVIIQHLDPSRESGLVQLLRRWIDVDVVQVEDGMQVERNTVYVIPPNHTLGLMSGALHLMTPSEPHHEWRTIDYFFRSLAGEQAQRAIGVVLSGAGTDGTMGLKVLKGAGGLTIAQDPETASHASMPNSAISTGQVDFILSPEEMASEILDYVDHAHALQLHDGEGALPGEANHLWQKVFFLLRSQTGHDFSHYKQSTIRRRVERRMLVNRVNSLDGYVRYLQHHAGELDLLFGDLLIGVTEFFRDRETFQALANKVLRPLIESKSPKELLRIWVDGCSTGEEAYSIAMVVHEQLEMLGRHLKVQIFATDIDTMAIKKARRGEYDEGTIADVSSERLARFFEQQDKRYVVKPFIRDTIVFAEHNTLQDPPFSNVDLVSCRNLLIYLGPELQGRLIPLLHYALLPHGYLFLGKSETLGRHSRLFKTLDAEARLFQRREVAPGVRPRIDFQSHSTSTYEPAIEQKRTNMHKSANLRQIAEETLLKNYTPSAVIVNADGDILYFHEQTGKYLEPAAGEATLNLLKMAREGLRLLLLNLVRKAAQDQVTVTEHHVQVKVNETFEMVDLTVRPLDHPEIEDLLLVLFQPAPAPVFEASLEDGIFGESDTSRQRVIGLEHELQNTREHLQSTVEDLETSNEELKSTNEELQSANEELQSTNEELTSAKEEVQSVNEELMTVNTELENKIDELSRANDDLHNLLTSVDIGIIFLDQDLRIARFSPFAAEFLNLRETDIDRPISDLGSKLDYRGLVDDAKIVLDTLESRKREVRLDDDWYVVRIRPYRTGENMIDGVIITIANITEQKHAQRNLHKLSRAVDQSTSIILITDVKGRIDYANQRFFEVARFDRQTIIGQPFSMLFADSSRVTTQKILDESLGAGQVWRGELLHQVAGEETYWASATISPITDEQGVVTHLIVVEEDITRRKELEHVLYERRAHQRETDNDVPYMSVLVFDRELQYMLGEGDALPSIGLSEADLEGEFTLNQLPSELKRYYHAVLRGDNVYFERESGGLWFGIQVMPVRNADGNIIAGVVVAWDITGHQDDVDAE